MAAYPSMTTNLTLESANNFSVASNLYIPQLASRSSHFQGEFEGLVHGISSFCRGLPQRAKIQGQIKAVLLGRFKLASGRRILYQLPKPPCSSLVITEIILQQLRRFCWFWIR